jgi:hypothetical protein
MVRQGDNGEGVDVHIYEIQIAGRYYVGKTSHSDASVRKVQHLEHLKEGTHHNYLMLDLFNAGHKPRFRVLESLGAGSTHADLDTLEKHYINDYATTFKGKCINLIGVGGELRSPQQKVSKPSRPSTNISGYEKDHAIEANYCPYEHDSPSLPQDKECWSEAVLLANTGNNERVPTGYAYSVYKMISHQKGNPPMGLPQFEAMLFFDFNLSVSGNMLDWHSFHESVLEASLLYGTS